MKQILLVYLMAFIAINLLAQQPANITVSGCSNNNFNGTYTTTANQCGGCLVYLKDGGTEWVIKDLFAGQWQGNVTCSNAGSFVMTASGGFFEDCDPTNGPAGANGCSLIASPLPVELTSLIGSSTGNKVLLTWATASELNNSGFQIQRSVDGERWEDLSFMEGHGATHEEQNYTYTDERPLPGLNYYRLKQIDFDGTFEYSKVISVEVGRDGSGISLYPNPVPKAFGSTATLAHQSDYTGEATLTLYDLLGEQMKTQVLSLEGGAFRTSIELAGLPGGVYLAVVTAGREQWRERLVVE